MSLRSIVLGVVGVAIGTALGAGCSALVSLVKLPDEVAPPPSPSVTPIATVTPSPIVPAPAPSPIAPSPTPTPVSFDDLSPCDQLDSIYKAGKSVAGFIAADWAKYGHVGSVCPWHQEQIELADRLVHPAVIHPTTKVQPVHVWERPIVKRIAQKAEPDILRLPPHHGPVPIEALTGADRIRHPVTPMPVHRERPVEGTCYMADRRNCPRGFNGNPYD